MANPFSDIGEKLQTKVGPLPAWAWIGGLTAIGALAILYFKSRSTASSTTAPGALSCGPGLTPDPTNTICVPIGSTGSTNTSSIPSGGGSSGGTTTLVPTGSGNGITGNQQTNCGPGTQLDPTGTFCIPTSILSPPTSTPPPPTGQQNIIPPTPVSNPVSQLFNPSQYAYSPPQLPQGFTAFANLTPQQQAQIPSGSAGVSPQELAYLNGGAAGENAFLGLVQQPTTIQSNGGQLITAVPNPFGNNQPTNSGGGFIPQLNTFLNQNPQVQANQGGGPVNVQNPNILLPPGFRGCTDLRGNIIPCP